MVLDLKNTKFVNTQHSINNLIEVLEFSNYSAASIKIDFFLHIFMSLTFFYQNNNLCLLLNVTFCVIYNRRFNSKLIFNVVSFILCKYILPLIIIGTTTMSFKYFAYSIYFLIHRRYKIQIIRDHN